MFFQESTCYLLEPQARGLGLRLPRLSTLQYDPKFSVAWNGKTLKYYAHKDQETSATLSLVFPLIPEWVRIWSWYWIRVGIYFPARILKRFWRRARVANDSA
jgi:hypothetical protein